MPEFSDSSPLLVLPYIQPSQAQKHVTHNEGLRRIDALVHLSVVSMTETAPPATPQDGARYILPEGASGVWSAQVAGLLAVFEGTAWAFYTPRPGWRAWVEDTGTLMVFDGAAWQSATGTPDYQNLPQVGVQTSADATNRLAVASEATLLTHAGAGHQVKVNKATATDTASLLFQTGWSGRAEMGTAGRDDFEIKVSADGTTFHSALVADAATGRVSFPQGADGLAPDDFGTGSLLTVDYAVARGTDLVTNGTGLLGNGYNFPDAFEHDPDTTPNLPASFSFSGYHTGTLQMQEYLPIDPNRVYRLSSYLHQESVPGDWSGWTHGARHSQFMGLLCLDIDGLVIAARHHMRYRHAGTDSLTTLTAPLTPGDTVVHVADTSGWNESSAAPHQRGLTLMGYRNAAGVTYDRYSRLVEFDMFDLGQVDKIAHTVTLKRPLPASLANPDDASGTWPAGTAIANSNSGESYKYAFYNGLHLPETDRWFHIQNHIGGIDRSGESVANNFPPGTALARVFWLPNYSNRPGGIAGYPDTGAQHRVHFAGISVMPEPLALMQKTASDAQQIKVPRGDFATNALNLMPAAPIFTPL